jgi:DNA-binding transcriptional LysR family regulator
VNTRSFSRVDLNLFRVFDAIFRSSSLTRAAQLLHVTQPAASNALARLRARFGDPLFVRAGRRIVPTPVAQSIADEVAGALRTLQTSLVRGRTFDPATSMRRFVVGMRDLLELALLPALAQQLRDAAPRIRLHSVRFEREQLARQLAGGELSFALDVPGLSGPGVRRRRLVADELCVVMRRGHPLARGALSIARWLAARHVVVSARASGPALEDFALGARGLEADVGMRCQHYAAAFAVVARSDLLLTAPRGIASGFRRDLALRIASAPLALPRLEVVMYWHESAEPDPGHSWMRERIAQLAGAAVQRRRRRDEST